MNVVLPLQVLTDDGSATGYFALGHWSLPRVPTVGEEFDALALAQRLAVERVVWAQDGRVYVRLQEGRVPVDALDALDRDGWEIALWQDEPPREWLVD